MKDQYDLSELQGFIKDWCEKTFPEQTIAGKAKKLQDESAELAEKPTDLIEQADVLIVLLQLASLTGHTTDDLMEAAWKKMKINAYKRKWVKMPDGTYQHIETHEQER